MDPDYFKGRTAELATMQDVLQPGEPCTGLRRLVLGGIGGMGKTQLALEFVQRHRTRYSSVFWFNATTEQTMKASVRSVVGRVDSPRQTDDASDERNLTSMLDWLADVRNDKWLLVFDNYDEPNEMDIERYIPYAGHGSIIVTTRLPDLVAGRVVRVQPLMSLDDCIEILRSRSGREGVAKGE